MYYFNYVFICALFDIYTSEKNALCREHAVCVYSAASIQESLLCLLHNDNVRISLEGRENRAGSISENKC